MLNQKFLSTLDSKDEDLNRVQTYIGAVVNPMLKTPILDGVVVSRLVIPASGKLLVPHGLGRPFQGVMVVAASAPIAVPYQLASDQTSPDGAVVLRFSSGAGATISLWVY